MSVYVHYQTPDSERCPLCPLNWPAHDDETNYHVHVGTVGDTFHVSVKPYSMIEVSDWPSGTKFLPWWRKIIQIALVCPYNYWFQYPTQRRLSKAIKAAQRFCEIEQANEERVSMGLAAAARSAR